MLSQSHSLALAEQYKKITGKTWCFVKNNYFFLQFSPTIVENLANG